MLTFFEATATAPIYKTGKPFAKDRYSIFLLVNDIYTTVHTHSRTMNGARKAARGLARNAQAYIEEAGMMPAMFAQLSNQAAGRAPLPQAGSVVYLTKEVAGMPVGSPLMVVESGWREEDEDCLPENTFPVMALPLTADGELDPDYAPFPLALDEYTTVAPSEPEGGVSA